MQRKPEVRILIVDDEPEMARVIADPMRDHGYEVDIATGGREAIDLVRDHPPDIVITDLCMPGIDGLGVLDGIRAIDDTIPVFIMTAFGAIDSAVEAVKRGAYHYFTKPFQLNEVLVFVHRALADREVREENLALRRLVQDRSSLGAMVGNSDVMQRLYNLVEQIGPTCEPVLITGESGTGKELVARALHYSGPRKGRLFVAQNCTALPEALLESELFGHAKGAFTGATAARQGLFVKADGGTLFLDEIGDMPQNLQGKLLRVLEDGEVRAVGSDKTRRVDVRIVAATNQHLEERVAQGRFRADLFYRLNVVPILVPPLRNRPDDIPLLVERFIAKARHDNPSTRLSRFSPDLMAAMASNPWPGNVRELENVVKRLAIVCTREVADVDDLTRYAPGMVVEINPFDHAKIAIIPMRQLEHEYMAWVVARCNGNKTRAAHLLGIDVSTIHRRGKTAAKAATRPGPNPAPRAQPSTCDRNLQ